MRLSSLTVLCGQEFERYYFSSARLVCKKARGFGFPFPVLPRCLLNCSNDCKNGEPPKSSECRESVPLFIDPARPCSLLLESSRFP